MKKLLKLFLKLAPLVILTVAPLFSFAQIPPFPTDPSTWTQYPWTYTSSYSPQYYDWQPIRYYGPIYSGHLNAEEPTVYVARNLTIETPNIKKPITVVAQKLSIAEGVYKTGVNPETKKALIAGSVRRNDASTVDLKVQVLRNNQVIWNSPEVFHYNSTAGTITTQASDLLPFVFKNIPVDQQTDTFVIMDISTQEVLFGPMSFESLGNIERLEEPFADAWYYKVKDDPLQKSTIYKTETECNTARNADITRTSVDPKCYQESGFAQRYDIWWFYYKDIATRAKSVSFRSEAECKADGKLKLNKDVICYTEHLKTIDVKLVVENPSAVGSEKLNYSKVMSTSARLLFRVDTNGAKANLAFYYREVGKTDEPIFVKSYPNIQTDLGKSTIIVGDLANLTKDTRYTVYIINEADLIVPAGAAAKKVSEIKKLFEGTIFTKETTSFIKNTMPQLPEKLLPNFDLNGVFNGPGDSNPLRLVTCGYDGANITTTVDNKLVVQPGPIDGVLLKPDPYFDQNKDGKIDGDGEQVISEWKNKNGMDGFQPHGETCDFNDIIGMIRRVQKYLLVIVPLIAAGMFAYAGYLFLTSAGNATTVQKAKDIMLYTMIGIGVVLLAWLIVANIYVLLGIDKDWSWLKL